MAKILISGKKRYIIRDDTDLHTNVGLIKGEAIKNAKSGDTLPSNKGVNFTVIESSFIDMYRKIKRGAQIIPQKDIGLIITETGITRDSTVIEAGAGSGAVGCYLSMICKRMISYEIRQDFFDIVKKNIETLGIENMELKLKDAKLGFDEQDADVVILDLPDPWELTQVAKKSLKVGGFVVSYSPSVPQVMDFVKSLDKDFNYVKTSEIIEREWEVTDRKVRPRSQAIGHSGFLSFARKIR